MEINKLPLSHSINRKKDEKDDNTILSLKKKYELSKRKSNFSLNNIKT